MHDTDGDFMISTERFEHLATHAAREDVRLESLRGEVGVKPWPDGMQGETLRLVTEHCLGQRPELWLYSSRGLRVEAGGGGRLRPDGALAPAGPFAGHGEWSPPDGVLMTLDITASASGFGRRARAYASVGIPVHLLIDRDAGQVLVHSDPGDGPYATVTRRRFGRRVEIPDPIGITLDTESLTDWTR